MRSINNCEPNIIYTGSNGMIYKNEQLTMAELLFEMKHKYKDFDITIQNYIKLNKKLISFYSIKNILQYLNYNYERN